MTNNNKVVENGVKESNGVAEKRTADASTEQPDKKKRILEKLHYEDLEDKPGNEDAQELKLSKVRFNPVFSYLRLRRY